MIVPDVIRKCVVFIGYRATDGSARLAGTGFLVARPLLAESQPVTGSVHLSFTYLLTAKHVLESIRRKGIDEVLVRFNYRDGQARWVTSRLDGWQYHPTEPDIVDVALFNVSAFIDTPNLDHGVFPIGGFATQQVIAEEEIGIGDETFIVGLFAPHHGNTKNIPIVRIGNIAAMPSEERVVTEIGAMDAYLIEARSIGGLSGSPVFVNLGSMRVKGGTIEIVKMDPSVAAQRSPGRIFLLGLMHGHYDEQSVNMGIGIVVPATQILEVMNQEAIVQVEKETRERQVAKGLPAMDSLPNDEPQPFKREQFEADLRRATRRVITSEFDEGKK